MQTDCGRPHQRHQAAKQPASNPTENWNRSRVRAAHARTCSLPRCDPLATRDSARCCWDWTNACHQGGRGDGMAGADQSAKDSEPESSREKKTTKRRGPTENNKNIAERRPRNLTAWPRGRQEKKKMEGKALSRPRCAAKGKRPDHPPIPAPKRSRLHRGRSTREAVSTPI